VALIFFRAFLAHFFDASALRSCLPKSHSEFDFSLKLLFLISLSNVCFNGLSQNQFHKSFCNFVSEIEKFVLTRFVFSSHCLIFKVPIVFCFAKAIGNMTSSYFRIQLVVFCFA